MTDTWPVGQRIKYQPNDQDRAALHAILGERLIQNEPAARHVTYRVGGPADYFLKATDEAELIVTLQTCRQREIPLLVVGNGSNMLVADKGWRGMMVENRLDKIELTTLDASRGLLRVGSGGLLGSLSRKIAKAGWSGLEFAATIPGSIGGGIVSNAGAHGGDFSQIITRLAVATSQGECRIFLPAEMQLNYRASRWRSSQGNAKAPLGDPGNELILWAEFLLNKGDPAEMKRHIDEMTAWRRTHQPQEPNAGSVFKNPPPPQPSAGSLIEAAGLKGHRIGGAQISPRHANFIVNISGASANDVLALINLARAAILERNGIELELENELLGDWN